MGTSLYDLFVGAFLASFDFLAIIAGVMLAVAVSGSAIWAAGYCWWRLFCWANKDAASARMKEAEK